MTVPALLALCLFVVALIALILAWPPTSWLTRSTPPPSHTFGPDVTSYLRDLEPPSFSTPAAKGISAESQRATDHQATVVPFIAAKRNARLH